MKDTVEVEGCNINTTTRDNAKLSGNPFPVSSQLTSCRNYRSHFTQRGNRGSERLCDLNENQSQSLENSLEFLLSSLGSFPYCWGKIINLSGPSLQIWDCFAISQGGRLAEGDL